MNRLVTSAASFLAGKWQAPGGLLVALSLCTGVAAQTPWEVFTDDFSTPGVNEANYEIAQPHFEGGQGTIAPTVEDGMVRFTGTTTEQWWSGGTLRVKGAFEARPDVPATLTIQRVKEAGEGTASRSAIMVYDATQTHYILFADVRGEGGWTYNRKIDAEGDNPTGTGQSIGAFDGEAFDHGGSVDVKVTADGNSVRLFLDGVEGAAVDFPFSPVVFHFGAFARANNDTADTTWDNLRIEGVARNVPDTVLMCPGHPLDGRTGAVADAIVEQLPHADRCDDVTDADLASITTLDLSGRSIQELLPGDFAGLDTLQTLNLSRNHLITLPAGLIDGLGELLILRLEDNDLVTLPPGFLRDQSKLQTLALNRNEIWRLEADTLATNLDLRQVDLSENNLLTLDENFFNGLYLLETVNLWNNGISIVPADLFQGLISLRKLNLWDNEIRRVPPTLFSGLDNLVYLGLGDNPITALDSDVFQGLYNLEELTLAQANLTIITPPIFDDLIHLRRLNLYDNQLVLLPAGIFDNLVSLEFLGISENHLGSVPTHLFDSLASLKDLVLEGNRFSRATQDFFDNFLLSLPVNDENRSLFAFTTEPEGFLTVSEGYFSSYSISLTIPPPFDVVVTPVSDYSRLFIQPSQLVFTPENWEEPQSFTVYGLYDANFDDARARLRHTFQVANVTFTSQSVLLVYIADLDEPRLDCPGSLLHRRTEDVAQAIVDAVDGVSDCAEITEEHLASITSLDLSGLGISSLRAGDLAGLTSLASLSLYNNRLTTLPEGIFSGLTALTELNLEYNRLDHLQENVFSQASDLERLYLGNNMLPDLPENVFDGLSGLEVLSLSDNRLQSLPDGLFLDLSSLAVLDLRNNHLGSLQDGAFAGLSSLQQLVLESNRIASISADAFAGLSGVRWINLNHNRLDSLPTGTFSGLDGLRQIWLANNRLVSLDPGTFAGLSGLTQLLLDNNGLTHLPPHTLPQHPFDGALESLVSLSLTGNPLDHMTLHHSVIYWRQAGVFVMADSEATPYLAMVSGDGQTGNTSTPLAEPFVVLLIGSDGIPMADTIVSFRIVEGTGSLTVRYARTDSEGKASTTLRPGTSEMMNRVEASSHVTRNSVVFSVNVEPRINHAPVVVSEFEDATLILGDLPTTMEVAGHFSDPNQDEIFHSVSSGDPDVVQATIEGTSMILRATGEGAATVTITVWDHEGLSVTAEMMVTVVPPEPMDYDMDDDGLIEIRTVRQLDAIRHDLDGNGTVDIWLNEDAYMNTFLGAIEGMGCPDGDCRGYELTGDLDFDTNGSGFIDPEDRFWDDGKGWIPLGRAQSPYTGVFEGNGHTIHRLMINRPYYNNGGLFGALGPEGMVTNLTVADSRIHGRHWTGSITGINHGMVMNCRTVNTPVTGETIVGGIVGHNFNSILVCSHEGQVQGISIVGGIAGWNSGTIAACANRSNVIAQGMSGGLAGRSFGTILNSLAVGRVIGETIGGITAENFGDITNSYFDADEARITGDADGKDTADLQRPTDAVGIYQHWNTYDLDADGAADAPWSFGSSSDYPSLR